MKIIYFAPVEWNSIKQRPQHIAELLAKTNDFYYVQPLGLRNIRLSDFARIIRRIKSFFSKKTTQKVNILNPFFIPITTNKFINKINILLLCRNFKNLIDPNTIIWITTPNSLMFALLQKLKTKSLIYEMLDDYAKIHPEREHEINYLEKQLIRKSNLVITTAKALQEKATKTKTTKKHVLVGNGVDYDFFVKSKARYIDPKFIDKNGSIKRVSEKSEIIKKEIQKNKKFVEAGFYVKITSGKFKF